MPWKPKIKKWYIMRESYDVLIVGSGAAGLFCALNLPQSKRVCIVTKQRADESDSFLAQGGICVLRGEEDYQNYYEDTLRAGHYENDGRAVELMIRSSNHVIRDLLRLGVDFTRSGGALAFTREGAHSRPRILFHEDITGQEITAALLARAQAQPNITIREHTVMVDLICRGNVCGGIVAALPGGGLACLYAPDVVLACGGLGGLFANTTNFPHITGDALAIALRHGIRLEHLDYIQIHPTTLYSTKPGRRFLISESVRGEGALLCGKDGRRFTDELQPRDLLTQAIHAQMARDGTDFVWEDLRPIGREALLSHFPHICERCREEGFDVFTQPIPVVPAQHYFMGGIAADLGGRTSMTGLYAVGETGCSGVHGRNRLASNSLLESLVFAQRAADDILFGSAHPGCDAEPDLTAYRDLDALFAGYRRSVLDEIERMKQSHE